jgi:hypothetical protein
MGEHAMEKSKSEELNLDKLKQKNSSVLSVIYPAIAIGFYVLAMMSLDQFIHKDHAGVAVNYSILGVLMASLSVLGSIAFYRALDNQRRLNILIEILHKSGILKDSN